MREVRLPAPNRVNSRYIMAEQGYPMGNITGQKAAAAMSLEEETPLSDATTSSTTPCDDSCTMSKLTRDVRKDCMDRVAMYRQHRESVVRSWTLNYIGYTIIPDMLRAADNGILEHEISAWEFVEAGRGTIKETEWMATDDSSWMTSGGVVGILIEWAKRSELAYKIFGWTDRDVDGIDSRSADFAQELSMGIFKPYIQCLAHYGAEGNEQVNRAHELMISQHVELSDTFMTLNWSSHDAVQPDT